MTETYYDMLGVAEDASISEIEAAYRQRLKETHPDISDAADAGDATRALITARDVLTDEAERERYDRVGHETYIGSVDESTDASTVAEAARRAGYGQRDRSATDTTASVDDRDGTAGTRERAQRERRANERVRRGQATRDRSTATSTEASGGDAGSTSQDPTATTAPNGFTVESGSNTWSTGASYGVRQRTDQRRSRRRLIPTGRSLHLFAMTFALYPVLLFISVLPAFPLTVNVVIGICMLLVIGYLQSEPAVAILVFGLWSVFTLLLVVSFDISVFSLVGVIALCGTWFPFGFSVLTYTVVRP